LSLAAFLRCRVSTPDRHGTPARDVGLQDADLIG